MAGYITPDPITARITDLGLRMMGIPNGLQFNGSNAYQYSTSDPFSEVFDGIALANTDHSSLSATYMIIVMAVSPWHGRTVAQPLCTPLSFMDRPTCIPTYSAVI